MGGKEVREVEEVEAGLLGRGGGEVLEMAAVMEEEGR